MMLRSVFNSLMRSRLRTLFTLLTIAIGTASFFLMTTLTELVPQSVDKSAQRMLGADVAVQSYLEPAAMQEVEQQAAEGLRSATGAFVGLSMIVSEERTSNIVVKGVETELYPYYGAEQFPDLRDLREDEVLLSRQAAERLQVQPGQVVSLPHASDGALTNYRVKGVVEGVQEGYTDSAFWGVAYLWYEQSLDLFGVPAGTINEAYLQLRDPADAGAVKERIEAGLTGSRAFDLSDKKQQLMSSSKNTLLVLQLFSLLALAIAGVTIYNTMAILMSSRLRDIAVMKTVGLKTREVARCFLLEASLLGVGGTLLGIGVGVAAGVGLTAYLGTMLMLPLDWQWSLQAIAFALGAGVSVSLIAAWGPVQNAVKIAPLDLLRDTGTLQLKTRLPFKTRLRLFFIISAGIGVYLHETLLASSQDGVVFKWIASFFLSMLVLLAAGLLTGLVTLLLGAGFRLVGRLKKVSPNGWYIALHNLGSSSKRNALLTITLAVGVLSVVASQLLSANVVSAVQGQMERQMKGNVLVSSAAADERKVEEVLTRTAGVESFWKGYEMKGSFVKIGEEDAARKFLDVTSQRRAAYLESTRVTVQGVDAKSAERPYQVKSGRDFAPGDEGRRYALLMQEYERDLGIRAGDTIEVELNDRKVALDVIGFFESGVVKSAGIRIPTSTLQAYGQPSRVSYYVEAATLSVDQTMTMINRALPSSAVAYSLNGSVLESLQRVLETQSNFFSMIALFAFLTAVLTIGNQVVLSLLQKQRDVAILKTVGHSTGRLIRSLLAENLILAFIAGLIGSVLGLLIAMFGISLLVKGLVDMDLTWCWIGIGLSVFTTAAVTLAASVQSLAAKPLQMLRGN